MSRWNARWTNVRRRTNDSRESERTDMRRSRWLLCIAAIAAAATLAGGCGVRGWGERFVDAVRPSTNVASEQHPEFRKYKVERIAVLPFEDRTGDPFLPPDTGVKLASFFYERLKSFDIYKLEGPGAPEAAMVQIELVKPAIVPQGGEKGGERREGPEEPVEEAVPEPRVLMPGKMEQMPFDAAVTGVVTEYQEREGSWLSVLKPASAKFTVYLISLKDGETLWKAEFNETQEALVDNLLKIDRFLKGGAGWQTSETLTRLGMERVVRTFPGVQEEIEAEQEAARR